MKARLLDAYAQKIKSPAAAVALIPPDARVAVGMAVAQPPALLSALASRAASEPEMRMTLYSILSTVNARETVLQRHLAAQIRHVSLFHSAVERGLDQSLFGEGHGPCDFMPSAFSHVPRTLAEEVGVDTLLTTVSSMDEEGYFSFGTNVDFAQPVSRQADRIIVEVNERMPRVSGNCTVHVSEVAAIVEHSAPLISTPRAQPRAEDVAIATIIADLVEDGACLQMGIGALPFEVCRALANHRHLGIHTELLTPALADLIRAGVVDNSRKRLHPGKTIFTFAMGDEDFYAFMHENADLEGHPVNYTNDPGVIAQIDKMVSVNATLQVDLFGACNSEFMNGFQFSGSGGQLDFVRGAYASRGGRSIIACHSTAAGGRISRIVPTLTGPVTTPRNDTHIIVTEQGWANLKGKTLRERARALIQLAHPRFRDELERSAREARIL